MIAQDEEFAKMDAVLVYLDMPEMTVRPVHLVQMDVLAMESVVTGSVCVLKVGQEKIVSSQSFHKDAKMIVPLVECALKEFAIVIPDSWEQLVKLQLHNQVV